MNVQKYKKKLMAMLRLYLIYHSFLFAAAFIQLPFFASVLYAIRVSVEIFYCMSYIVLFKIITPYGRLMNFDNYL